MAGTVSAGVKPIFNLTQNSFTRTSETTIQGRQAEDATEYPKDVVASAQLSKLEEIVEYLKVLYR